MNLKNLVKGPHPHHDHVVGRMLGFIALALALATGVWLVPNTGDVLQVYVALSVSTIVAYAMTIL